MPETTAEAFAVIDAEPSRVWKALTDPAEICQYYLGAKVTTDWQVGSPITWSGDWKGTPFEDCGEILAYEPERRLTYSHWSPSSGTENRRENYHVVDISLGEAGGATSVTLTQANLDGTVTEADREHRQDYEQNWATVLDGLKRTVEN